MHTKESIEQFIFEWGYKPTNCKKEVKDLPGLLQDDEVLHGLLEAQFKDVHKQASSGYGLAIMTNQRILCYRKSFIGTVTSEEIPLSKITGVSYRKGLMFGSVIVTASGNESIFENCSKSEAEKFAGTIKSLLADVNNTSPTAAAHQKSNLDELEKLFELKQKGILTEEEFATQKAKLLS